MFSFRASHHTTTAEDIQGREMTTTPRFVSRSSTHSLLSVCLLIGTHFSTVTSQIPIHIITGTKFEEITTLIPYHSTTQLLYKVPFHSKITENIPKLDHTPETCDRYFSSRLQDCKDRRYLTELQNNIHEILNLNKQNFDPNLRLNYKKTPKRNKRAIDFIGNALYWCCNVATMTNLQDLSQNEVQVDDKLNNLLDYVKEEHKDLVIAESKMNNFSLNLNTVLQNLHSSLANYDNNFKLNMNESTKHLETRLVKFTQETWLYIYLGLYYSRLNAIEQDCQSNKIPQDLISIPELQTDLIQLQNSLNKRNLTLAIPDSKAYHLYNLPLSKCYFDNNSIIVQVKIPIQQLNLTYKSYTYHPIPLKWEDKICTLSKDNFIIIVTSLSHHIIDLQNNKYCNYKDSNLCLIPRIDSHTSSASKCAKYIMNGTTLSSLKDFCEFHCEPIPNHPVITQHQVNKFFITNIVDDLIVNCDNNDLSTKIPKIDIGTIEVELPCNCKIYDKSGLVLINTVTPCDSRDFGKPVANHLIPLPWTNLDDLKIDPLDIDKRTEFFNISSLILPDWNITTPTFLVKNLERATLFNHIHLKATWTDIIDDRRLLIYIIFAWTLILTLIIILLAYHLQVLKIKMRMLQPPVPPRSHLTRSTISMTDQDRVQETQT